MILDINGDWRPISSCPEARCLSKGRRCFSTTAFGLKRSTMNLRAAWGQTQTLSTYARSLALASPSFFASALCSATQRISSRRWASEGLAHW